MEMYENLVIMGSLYFFFWIEALQFYVSSDRQVMEMYETFLMIMGSLYFFSLVKQSFTVLFFFNRQTDRQRDRQTFHKVRHLNKANVSMRLQNVMVY